MRVWRRGIGGGGEGGVLTITLEIFMPGQTLRRLNRLQEQRLSELEREIRERAPGLAGRLGL